MNISDQVISELAESLCEKISRKVIKLLQGRQDLLFGESSGLKNTWDEICIQVQGDRSYYWEAYDQTVRSIISAYMEDLKHYELMAISLQTQGFEYDEATGQSVSCESVEDYIAINYVYKAAGFWSNHRISSYRDGF